MNKRISKRIVTLIFLATTIVATAVHSAVKSGSKATQSAADGQECKFDDTWITNPKFLDEVAESGEDEGKPDSNFCDFYRFSWQNFLYLVSPVAGPTSVRKDDNAYPAIFWIKNNTVC